LCAQVFPHDEYEVIITCHGNLDITEDKLPFKHKKVVYTESDGYNQYCKVANKGIKNCEGDLVFFMHNSVELIETDYLSRLWQISEEGKHAVQTLKKNIVYDSNGVRDEFKDSIISEFLLKQDAVPLHYLEEVGGLSEEYDGDHGFMDLDLYLKLKSMTDCKFVHCNLKSIKHDLRHRYIKLKSLSNIEGERNVGIYNQKWANKKLLLS
jgi:hypothetical protein